MNDYRPETGIGKRIKEALTLQHIALFLAGVAVALAVAYGAGAFR